jgi:hypothetical protein
MRYKLQAHLVRHFGLGPLQREWTCTSKLDPYRLAVILQPRSSAVGLKNRGPSLRAQVCDTLFIEKPFNVVEIRLLSINLIHDDF